MILGIEIIQLVDDLALFHAAVSDGRQKRFPVPETVLAQDDFLIGRFHQVGELHAMSLGVRDDQLSSLGNVVIFILTLEPLVDLVPGGSALCNCEPVQTGTLGRRACQDLDAVAVFDLIIDRDDLVVDSGTDHTVAHRCVDGIGKIDRC